MNINANPTDQEFLESLMISEWRPLPSEINEIQRALWHQAVEEMIESKQIEPERRETYLNILLDQHDPRKMFQGNNIERIKKKAIDKLNFEESELHKTPVGIFSTHELNACAIRTPSGTAVIALYISLWFYLKSSFFCVLAIALRNSETPLGEHHSDETYAINLLQMAEAAKKGIQLIVMTKTGEHSIADCVGPSASPDYRVVASLVESLTFILLHEYGHIFHGHLNSELIRMKVCGENKIEIYLTSHEQEYEADCFAIKRILESKKDSEEMKSLSLFSISMLFHFFDLCESERSKEIMGSHPPSLNRLKKIINVAENYFAKDLWKEIEKSLISVENIFNSAKKFEISLLEVGYEIYNTF